MELKLNEIFLIPENKNFSGPKFPVVPLTHNGWWWKHILKIEVNLSSGWLFRWQERKANNDIQKLIGYTFDLGKKNSVRLGVNAGGHGKGYDGKNLTLWNYLHVNGKYPGHDPDNMIGIIPVNEPCVIYHKIDEEYRPNWAIGDINALRPYGPYAFSKPSSCLLGMCGYNYYPYYEAGINNMGAKYDLIAKIKVSIV